MNNPGPRNGYTWTHREMMQRRDQARWQRAHAWVTCAPLSAIVFFPIGTMVGGIGYFISAIEQRRQIASPFTDGSEQFSRPIAIQRVFAAATMIFALSSFGQYGVAGVLGVLGGALWLRLLSTVEKRTKLESEVECADRETLQVDPPRIRE